MGRKAKVERRTSETHVELELCLDGNGVYEVETSIPFLDHMLALFAKHGLFDLKVRASGDTAVDFHHTAEDIGICLGRVFQEALGDKKGICRYGEATVPMVDALASVAVDFSGRPHVVFRASFQAPKVGEIDVELFEEFFRAFSHAAGADLHIRLHYGNNVHHCIEAIFKAAARACDGATRLDPRQPGVLSTKGTLTS
ncbi:MAG: imidazoleglycerol-phosphate dehydratase HisB [bacterium]